ncbi:MAG: TonB-dependent receptor [Polyangia bacterium]
MRADKADTLKKASGSSTLITEEDIKRAQPDNAGDMLRRVPGLQVRQEDQTGFRLNLGVRGLSPTRSRLVLVEEDGVPLVVSPYGEPELYYTTSVERIRSMDVVKGSDVLRYGPQTVGAVIQIHTWDPTPTPTYYNAVAGGTQHYFETMSRFSNTTKNGIGYVAEAYYKRGDGFRQMHFQAADAMGKVHIPLSASSELGIKVGFHWDHVDSTYTGLTDTQYAQNPRQNTVAPDDYQSTQRYEVALTHEKRFGHGTTLRSILYAYQMNLGFRIQDIARFAQPGVDYQRSYTDLYFLNSTSLRSRVYDVVGASTQLEQRFSTGFVKHKITVGARFTSDNARRKLSEGQQPTSQSGNLLTDDTTNIFGLGAFVEDQIALTDWLLVTPAFRIEYSRSQKTTHRLQNDDGSVQDVNLVGTSSANGPMPGVSVVAGRTWFNAFTSLYRGYSAPRVGQAITPEGKDANLHAERSVDWEIGVRGRLRNVLSAEADLFLINFDNQLVSNNPLTTGTSSEFIDGGKTQHFGAEATAQARFGKWFHLPVDVDVSGHYTFVHSRFVGGSVSGLSTNGKTIPYSPAQTAVAVLDVSHRIGVGAQVAFSYIGSQYSDEQNTIAPAGYGLTGRIPAYTTLDLAARYHNARTGIGVALSVKNAVDNVYISDRLPNGIFTAGFRQILGTLSWSSGS